MTGRDRNHTQLTCYIPVHAIYDHVTIKQEKILLSVYCLTGCDTVSAFFGHGKHTAFQVMMDKAEQLQDLALPRSNKEPTAKAAKMAATKFNCWLHVWQDELHITECLAG